MDKVDYASVAEIDSSTQLQVIPKMKKMIINGYYLDKNGRITTKNISDENENEIYVREVYTFPNDSSVKGKKLEDYKVKSLSI